MRKLFLPFLFTAIFFSCEKKEDTSVADEEKKLRAEINRIDSFPELDIETTLKFYKETRNTGYYKKYLDAVDSVISNYSKIKTQIEKELSSGEKLNYPEIYSSYRSNAEKLRSFLSPRDFLPADYAPMYSYKNKLDGLYGFDNRNLKLFSLLQLSFMKQKCLLLLSDGFRSSYGCGFGRGFEFRNEKDSSVVFYTNYGKDLPGFSFMELFVADKNGSKQKLIYFPGQLGDPDKSSGLVYNYVPSGDLYRINLKDSSLKKGNYKLVNRITLHKPTGESEWYNNETIFKIK